MKHCRWFWRDYRKLLLALNTKRDRACLFQQKLVPSLFTFQSAPSASIKLKAAMWLDNYQDEGFRSL